MHSLVDEFESPKDCLSASFCIEYGAKCLEERDYLSKSTLMVADTGLKAYKRLFRILSCCMRLSRAKISRLEVLIKWEVLDWMRRRIRRGKWSKRLHVAELLILQSSVSWRSDALITCKSRASHPRIYT